GIKKGVRIRAFELQRPRLAAIYCLVNSRSVARASAEQIGSRLSKRFDITKVELFGAGDRSYRPHFAAVGSAPKSTLSAADPNDLRTYNAKAAEIGFGI